MARVNAAQKVCFAVGVHSSRALGSSSNPVKLVRSTWCRALTASLPVTSLISSCEESGEQIIQAVLAGSNTRPDPTSRNRPSLKRAPDPKNELLARFSFRRCDEVDVEGVAPLAQVRLVAVGPVVISLNLKIVAVAQLSRPARQDVAAGEIRIAVEGPLGRRRVGAELKPARRLPACKCRPADVNESRSLFSSPCGIRSARRASRRNCRDRSGIRGRG